MPQSPRFLSCDGGMLGQEVFYFCDWCREWNSSDSVSEFEPEPSLLHGTSSSSAEDDSSDEVGRSALRRQVEPYLLTLPVQSAAACLSCSNCNSSSSCRCSAGSGNHKFTGRGSYISRSVRLGLLFTNSSFSTKTYMTRGGATCRCRGLFHSPLANHAKQTPLRHR